MSGVRITHSIDIADATAVMAQLSKANRQQLGNEIGEYVLSETLFNFQNERTPDGERWTPSQRAQEENGKTLQDFGHLRDSYTYLVGLGGEFVEIGSNMIYAAIHHFGGQAGRNRAVEIEARPALGITPEMEGEIGDMAIAFYANIIQ